MEPRNPLQTAAAGPFWKPWGGCRERNLRPRKNFAVFRRFPRTETALEPGCGAGLEAKGGYETPKPAATGFFFGKPGPDAGRGNLRPRKNFAVFRRFPQVGTVGQPGPGGRFLRKKGMKKRRDPLQGLQRVLFWEAPGPNAGEGAFGLRKNFAEFRRVPRCHPACKTRPSGPASIKTHWPGSTEPSSRRLAKRVSTVCWTYRRRGRAPYWGS